MTATLERLSRLRQSVGRLRDEADQLLSVLLGRTPMVRGTVYELRRKCGKPSCCCATEGQLHPVTVLSVSEEGGEHACLDVIPGRVKRLPHGLKVPHMGWNQVRQRRAHPVFDGIEDNAYFYFVHSYYPSPEDEGVVIGETEYGLTFASVIGRDNVVATQFHPEKSGSAGLRFYANFLRVALGAPA